ncbi:hypothetical protein BC831DRAFT_477462 [Entophlyctis helioformis]|nr:hypothetical protein BC831DRAFT_477462 [Entophlyctis helioformis]
MPMDAHVHTDARTDAPRPHGPRMAKLVRAVDHALQAVLKDCSDAKFAQSFPQLARDNPVALAQARQDVVAQFQASVMSSFDKLVSDRQIDARLNDLDVLIEAARQRPAASYSGPPPAPQDIATVRRYNAKLLERKRLLDKLTAVSVCIRATRGPAADAWLLLCVAAGAWLTALCIGTADLGRQ